MLTHRLRSAGQSHFGEAEIEHLRAIARADEDVGGLDVAVDDARGMGGLECVRDLDPQPEHRIACERTGGESVLQRRALEVLHGDERSSVLLADVVDGADMWMAERRSGSGFTLKAAQRFGIARQISGDELERHGTVKPRILGLVDHAHPAAAELADDAVVRERLTDQGVALGVTAADAALSRQLACGEVDRWSGEKAVGAVVCGEQRTDVAFQLLVAAAGAS